MIHFGIPAIFLTINPDDLRNFRIVVYSLAQHKVTPYGEVDLKTYAEANILAEFNVREDARAKHPGLCAEEYQRIMELVIKHFFKWDTNTQESNDVGLFGNVIAWCLATEEQGRKSLHGHYLVFIKDWNRVMNVLQRMKTEDNSDSEKLTQLTYKDACGEAKAMFINASSARLFSDFATGKPLSQTPVFHHENCRSDRNRKVMRYTVKPVENQKLREMRHKTK